MRTIDFMRWRAPAAVISLVIFVLCIGSLLVKGLNFGIDFTGGTVVELSFPTPVVPTQLRAHLERAQHQPEAGQDQPAEEAAVLIERVDGDRGAHHHDQRRPGRPASCSRAGARRVNDAVARGPVAGYPLAPAARGASAPPPRNP